MTPQKCPPGEPREVRLTDASFVIRPMLPAPKAGWPQLALGEWTLDRSGFGDCHPFDEVNYVLEGVLEVESGGLVVRVGAGEAVRVPAGTPAFYRAHGKARMLYIYGPNPDGLPSDDFFDPKSPRHA